jgi:hypothetical protein
MLSTINPRGSTFGEFRRKFSTLWPVFLSFGPYPWQAIRRTRINHHEFRARMGRETGAGPRTAATLPLDGPPSSPARNPRTAQAAFRRRI